VTLVTKLIFAILFAGTVAVLLAWPVGCRGRTGSGDDDISGAGPTGTEKSPIRPDNPSGPAESNTREDTRRRAEKGEEVNRTSDKGEEPKGRAVPAPGGKSIGMAEAVTIAEKLGKGAVTKAERRDKPDPLFKFELIGRDGQKQRIELNPDGTLRTIKKDN
jgi:hypothetical protein